MHSEKLCILLLAHIRYVVSSSAGTTRNSSTLNCFNADTGPQPPIRVSNPYPLTYQSVTQSYSEIGVQIARTNGQARQQVDKVLSEILNVNLYLTNLKQGPIKSLQEAGNAARRDLAETKKRVLNEIRAVGERLLMKFKDGEKERSIIADAIKDVAINLEDAKVSSNTELGSPLGLFGKILDRVEKAMGSLTKAGKK